MRLRLCFAALTLLFNTHVIAADALSSPSTTPNHILFLMHKGKAAQALEAYQQYVKETGSHDFELLESVGLILLDQGYRSKDTESRLMTLFGAGISLNEKSLYIIEDGLDSKEPELELIALNFLGQYQSSRADQALYRAMISSSLLIRLEAAFKLSQKKDPRAVGHTESLMAKLPEQLWPLFPQLFAVVGTPEAKKILRKMLTNSHESVRIATVDSLAEYGHDDFLPVIRRLASQHGAAQQEACATALGLLKDEDSASRLLDLVKSPNENVKLAALNALYLLGRHEVRGQIEVIASKGNAFAIFMLGDIPGSEEALIPLLKSDNIHVRMNAAFALLNLKNSQSLPHIAELLLTDSRDLGAVKISSPGKSLNAIKIIPSAHQNLAESSVEKEMSLHIREAALTACVELPEKEFLAVAQLLFEKQQNDLVPTLIEILINHPTPAVIKLLKTHQQQAGAPLVRNYCNLALYKLKEEGPYADNLEQWVTQQRNIDLIKFRPIVPWSTHEDEKSDIFSLTPQETSRLLVEAFEAFVASQDDKGINMLINLIQTGNQKNKYALIGLLMRTIQ